MKYVLIVENDDTCYICPLCNPEFGWLGDIKKGVCRRTYDDVTVYLDGVSGRPKWCPLKHPLKYASNDFYIYDTKYLMENLDREINLLKGTKAFEEIMEKQNESKGNV